MVPSESVRLNVYNHSVRPAPPKRTIPNVERVGKRTSVQNGGEGQDRVSGNGGSQWESNPPTTQVPYNGFEARTQRRPRMASGTIVAESLQRAGGDGKLVGSHRPSRSIPGRLMVGQRPLEP